MSNHNKIFVSAQKPFMDSDGQIKMRVEGLYWHPTTGLEHNGTADIPITGDETANQLNDMILDTGIALGLGTGVVFTRQRVIIWTTVARG